MLDISWVAAQVAASQEGLSSMSVWVSKISVGKTKAMATNGKTNERTKTVINNNIIEQVNSFNYLGYTITVTNNIDLEMKMDLIKRAAKLEANWIKDKTQMKFSKAVTVLILA
jgi:hypothetical protein